MARYRKIDPRMWGDKKFCALSKPQPNAQTLWQYLLTGPHTNSCPGLFNIGEAALAENLGWALEQFRKRFRELLDKGMVKSDFRAHVILIPKAINYDPPDNPNVVKHWGKMYDEIPECDLKREYYQIVKRYIEELDKQLMDKFMKAFDEGFKEPFRDSLTIPEPFLNHSLTIPKEEERSLKHTLPDVKKFIDFYFEEFKKAFRNPPLIEGGKDGTIVKTLLKNISFEELKELLIKFFKSDDEFILKSGYTLGVFKSQINKLRIKKSEPLFKPQPGIAAFVETERKKKDGI